MKKTKQKFINVILAVVLVVNQTAFFMVADFVRATTDTATDLTINFMAPPSTVSGFINIQAQTNVEADEVYFLIFAHHVS